MDDWTVKDKNLEFHNGNTVTFEYGIEDAREVNKIVIVMLDIPADRMLCENVFGVLSDGSIKWQIEPLASIARVNANNYVWIGPIEDNKIYLYNWFGTGVWVDCQTGRILETVLAK